MTNGTDEGNSGKAGVAETPDRGVADVEPVATDIVPPTGLEPARQLDGDGGGIAAVGRVFMDQLRLIFVVVVAAVTLPYCIFTISINGQRAVQLALTEASLQRGYADLGKLPGSENPAIQIKDSLQHLQTRRDSLIGQIGYGMWNCSDEIVTDCLRYQPPQCLVFPGPDCFHGNSSEHNNILLALAAGILGAVLSIASTAYAHSKAFLLRTAICQILTGASVGLLALFAIKGIKGQALPSIADTVDVNGPYGVALTCTLAGLFSDDFIKALGGLFKRLTDKISKPPPQDAEDMTAEGSAKKPS